MKKLILFCMLMMVGMGVQAQKTSVKLINIDLWQDGLPNSNGMESQGYDDAKRNYKPSISVYLPQNVSAPTKAVLVLPGGGYTMLCLDYEGHEWAEFFLGNDIATIVVKYRLPYGHCEVPQSDVFEAIRLVRAHAAEWNIDPNNVGVMGFSAGGHLTSTVSTHWKDRSERPDFQICMYPLISADPSITILWCYEQFLGKNPSQEQLNLYSNELQVREDTPRAFIGLSDDDSLVSPLHSTKYYEALKKHHVSATLHIYATGEHGWGINENFRYHLEMLGDLRAWLRSF